MRSNLLQSQITTTTTAKISTASHHGTAISNGPIPQKVLNSQDTHDVAEKRSQRDISSSVNQGGIKMKENLITSTPSQMNEQFSTQSTMLYNASGDTTSNSIISGPILQGVGETSYKLQKQSATTSDSHNHLITIGGKKGDTQKNGKESESTTHYQSSTVNNNINKICEENMDKYNGKTVANGVGDLKFTNSTSQNFHKHQHEKAGDDTSTSTASKKPQFQFVCMEPTKDQRTAQTVKMYSIANKSNKHAHLIDPQTLSRILKLQSQQRASGSIGNSSGSGQVDSFQLRQHYNTSSTPYNLDNYRKPPSTTQWLNIERIGICGIPSLWMTRDELLAKGHIFRDSIEEQERLELMLRILQSHKRYENDKYYGGSTFKRGNQVPSSNAVTTQSGSGVNPSQSNNTIALSIGNSMPTGSAEYIWFSTDNLKNIKMSVQSQSPGADESEVLQLQALPHIRNYDQSDALTFKIMQAEAKLVRLILENHGFCQTDSNDWNILWTCTSSQQKQFIYENLHEYQKINHFVNAAELTRKDRLCFNVGKMKQKFGPAQFDFLPETYILPDEFPDFQKQFQQRKAQQIEDEESQNKNLWIIKPTSSSQGKGIFMIDEIFEVPQNESLVISKYIDNPLLINGLKFDLRLYVLVTNFDPLKIYVYNEGLVRFASEPYSLDSIKSNVYAHLTNYSINKKSENFVQNKNITERDIGNKWSLSALQSHLESLGIDMKVVWARIYDAIIKSIISVENQVVSAIKKVQNTSGGSIKQNCFDLFGFDIILDQDLKPWILEVNLSPSLAFDSPLDFHIKSNLIIDVLNVVGIKKHNRKKDTKQGGSKVAVKQNSNLGQTTQHQSSLMSTAASSAQNQSDQKKRQSAFSANTQNMQSQSQLQKLDINGQLSEPRAHHASISQKNSIENIDLAHMERLSKISAKHRELLREHLEEFCLMRQYCQAPNAQANSLIYLKPRTHNFTRIFPAPGTHVYDTFLGNDNALQTQTQQQQQKQWNKILYRYLYDRTSELQDIINQINKQNHLNQENQRRVSQAKLANQQNHRCQPQQQTMKIESESEPSEKIDDQNGIHSESKQNCLTTNQEPAQIQSSSEHLPSVHQQYSSNSSSSIAQRFKIQTQPNRSQSSMSNNTGFSGITSVETDGGNLHSSTMKSIYLQNNKNQERGLSPVNTQSEIKKRTIIGGYMSSTNDYNSVSNGSKQEATNKQQSNNSSSGNNLLQSMEHVANNSGGVGSRVPHQNTKSQTSTNDSKAKTAPTMNDSQSKSIANSNHHSSTATNQIAIDSRIVVTGDDILIEYVRRIMNLARQFHSQQVDISKSVKAKLDQFANHRIWQPKDEKKPSAIQQFQNSHTITGPTLQLWQKIEGRFNEMGERKRRLFLKKQQAENKSKPEIPADKLELMFKQQEKQKSDIVKDFSSSELELMLKQSNKNNPIEVVTLLLSLSQSSQSIANSGGGGVLTKLEGEFAYLQKAEAHQQTIEQSKLIEQGGGQTTFETEQPLEESTIHLQTTKERQFQSNILNRLRQSDDQVSLTLNNGGGTSQKRATAGGSMQPESSPMKKDFFMNSQGLSSLENGGLNIKNTNSYYNQHGILGIQGASQIHNNSSTLKYNPPTVISTLNLQKSNSKMKNPPNFDRSDIALQTGLTLTSKAMHKIGSSSYANNSTLADQSQMKVTLPQISTTTNQTFLHQQYSSTGSNSAGAASKVSTGHHITTAGSSTLQQASSHIQNGGYTITSLGIEKKSGISSHHHDLPTTKYRTNKIQTSYSSSSNNVPQTATISKTPAINNDSIQHNHNHHSNKYTHNLREQHSLNSSMISGDVEAIYREQSANAESKSSNVNLHAALRRTVAQV